MTVSECLDKAAELLAEGELAAKSFNSTPGAVSVASEEVAGHRAARASDLADGWCRLAEAMATTETKLVKGRK